MARHSHLSLLLSVLCFVGALHLPSLAAADAPAFVVVVHRHGARMPVLPFNQSIVCPNLPCGALIPEGKEMLRSLGRYMTQNYPAQFQSSSYSPYAISVRSTSIPRTIQSADAFLWGAFPNATAFYPVIENVPIAEDTLLDPQGSWPASIVHQANPTVSDEQSAAVVQFAASLGIGSAALMSFAAETEQYGLCPAYPFYCLLAAQDLAESLKSRGLLTESSYPALYNYTELLNSVAQYLNRLKFQYNATDPQWLGTGSFGQPLAAAILQQAESFMNGELTYNVKQFSAHDTTLMPLYVSLDITNELRPRFAEAIIMEFYVNSTADGLIVKARRGYPEQTPGPHTYHFESLQLSCMSEQGHVMKSESCSVGDFKRAIARFDPTPIGGGVGGMCYFSPDDQAASCPSAPATPPDHETQSVCLQFRKRCLRQACPQPSLLNVTAFTCFAPPPSTTRASGATSTPGGTLSPFTLSPAGTLSPFASLSPGFTIAPEATVPVSGVFSATLTAGTTVSQFILLVQSALLGQSTVVVTSTGTSGSLITVSFYLRGPNAVADQQRLSQMPKTTQESLGIGSLASPPSPGTPPASDSTGIIVGASVGGAVLVIALIIVVILVTRKKKPSEAPASREIGMEPFTVNSQ